MTSRHWESLPEKKTACPQTEENEVGKVGAKNQPVIVNERKKAAA